MSTERFFLVDPYNVEHISLIEAFEEEQDIHTKTSEYLKNLLASKTQEEYLEDKRNSNEFQESLFIESDSKIKDSCHLEGEKDLKTCRITFAPIKNKPKNRTLITLATDYALNTLGMEEVFITSEENDKNMIENLEKRGFISLGSDNGSVIYIKEKEEYLEGQIKTN